MQFEPEEHDDDLDLTGERVHPEGAPGFFGGAMRNWFGDRAFESMTERGEISARQQLNANELSLQRYALITSVVALASAGGLLLLLRRVVRAWTGR